MPAHTHLGIPPRHPRRPAVWAAAAFAVLAVSACSSSTSSAVPASAVSTKPVLTGSGSTFDAPFFSAAFPRYEQQHPGVTIDYSAVGSSAGIAAFSAGQVSFGASDVPMTANEQAYSMGLLLPFAAIRNQAGDYVIPSAQSVTADAAQKPVISPTDFSIVNEPGASSYPISGYSWALIYTYQPSQDTGQALVAMLDWLTHNGQVYAAADGYVPLPSKVQQLARIMLKQITGPGGAHLLS